MAEVMNQRTVKNPARQATARRSIAGRPAGAACAGSRARGGAGGTSSATIGRFTTSISPA